MRVVEDLADNLAKDAIELANKLGDDDVIYETAKVLVATSSTMEEAYMTSIGCDWQNDARGVFLRKRRKRPKRRSLCHLAHQRAIHRITRKGPC